MHEGTIGVLGYAVRKIGGRAGGTVYIHRQILERALGKPLPKGAVVHHVNEDRADNRPQNLVLCPDQKYHKLLHKRMRARDACGRADWRRCWRCKEFDEPANLRRPEINPIHPECYREYMREWHRNR